MSDLDAIRERAMFDGECEHGFWHTDCPNTKCWLRDIRVVLDALDEDERAIKEYAARLIQAAKEADRADKEEPGELR